MSHRRRWSGIAFGNEERGAWIEREAVTWISLPQVSARGPQNPDRRMRASLQSAGESHEASQLSVWDEEVRHDTAKERFS